MRVALLWTISFVTLAAEAAMLMQSTSCRGGRSSPRGGAGGSLQEQSAELEPFDQETSNLATAGKGGGTNNEDN